jgi:hypothetical protein
MISLLLGCLSQGLPLVDASEWLEECDQGAMGQGARFKQSGGAVIMRVDGRRGPLQLAKAWRKGSDVQHTTECFVNEDGASSERPVIVLSDLGEGGAEHMLKNVWDQCDQKQCKTEGKDVHLRQKGHIKLA